MERLPICLNFCFLAVLPLLQVLGQAEALPLSLVEEDTPQNFSLPAEVVNVVCKANCGTGNSTAKLPVQALINKLCEQAGIVDKGDSGDCQPAVPDVMPLLTDCSKIFRYLKGANRIPSGPWRIKPDNMETSVEPEKFLYLIPPNVVYRYDYEFYPDHWKYGSLQERYWVSSRGVAIKVDDSVPLHVGLNDTVTEPEQLCLMANFSHPYNNPTGAYPVLKYTVCHGGHLRDIHDFMADRYFRKPRGIPDDRDETAILLVASQTSA
ncbi:uncharacterized protein LOC118409072 [Branchiostoma floridae]|uniref:Uncharacterized protein LOC118409072 n=1 Tax=Branchiostoma floridae TaxID=7739 RepID=A0A9J7HW58_BRAFL|nr:uncharacterized protein LOC118409072 [Branchiostoma floridae]